MSAHWHYANFEPSSPIEPTPHSTFTISTSAQTDIWRKPPSIDVFTAPVVYRLIPASTFIRARVTVKADWKTLYDQGGIYLRLPPTKTSVKPRWLKSGIEFEDGRPLISVVVALDDVGADWSLLPVTGFGAVEGKLTVEIERERSDQGVGGTVLRVYVIAADGGERFMIREITTAFWDTDEDDDIWIGAYTAKPTEDQGDRLVVDFSGFTIDRL